MRDQYGQKIDLTQKGVKTANLGRRTWFSTNFQKKFFEIHRDSCSPTSIDGFPTFLGQVNFLTLYRGWVPKVLVMRDQNGQKIDLTQKGGKTVNWGRRTRISMNFANFFFWTPLTLIHADYTLKIVFSQLSPIQPILTIYHHGCLYYPPRTHSPHPCPHSEVV